MSRAELRSIVLKGYETYRHRTGDMLEIDDRAATSIAHLAQGFPYYAHLLAGAAGALAIRRGDSAIDQHTVVEAMLDAVEDAAHEIRMKYREAVDARSDAQFDLTLLGCALAKVDDLGYFSTTDITQALRDDLGQERSAANFNHHLKRFANHPSWILEQRRLGAKTIRYRFHDPLMRPFVLLKAIQSGTYDIDVLTR